MIDAVRTAYEAVQKTRNLPKARRGNPDFRCRLDQPQPSIVGDQIIESIEKVNVVMLKYYTLETIIDFFEETISFSNSILNCVCTFLDYQLEHINIQYGKDNTTFMLSIIIYGKYIFKHISHCIRKIIFLSER